MKGSKDGPAAAGFTTVSFKGNITLAGLSRAAVSKKMKEAVSEAPTGRCVCWGIPFRIDRPLLIKNRPVTVKLKKLKTKWLVFMHASDMRPLRRNRHGFISPMRGIGHLGNTPLIT